MRGDERDRREVAAHLGVDRRLGEGVGDRARLGIADPRPHAARHRVDVGRHAELAGGDLHGEVDERARGVARRRSGIGSARACGRAPPARDLRGDRRGELGPARRGGVADQRRGHHQRATSHA